MKSTVISFVPFEINADKITLHPGFFRVPASDTKNPEVLIVGDSGYDVYLGAERKPSSLRVKATSEDIARAIVDDFKGSLIATGPGAYPAIFYVPGEFQKEDIWDVKHQTPKKFNTEMNRVLKEQEKWFVNLVSMADDDWVKSNHKPTAISNLQRTACKLLGMTREWVENVTPRTGVDSEYMNCPICTVQIKKSAVICPTCKVVLKPEEAKNLTFAGA